MKYDIQIFVKKFNRIHNNKYDYSLIDFNTVNDEIKIICPEHGEFMQKVKTHLSGSGCPKCGKIKIYEKLKDNKEKFIKRIVEIYGDKYDYSKVEYINSYTKILIICREHGEFKLTPNQHLKGNGCPICKKNFNFIEKAKSIHGNKYNYSKVKYINSYTKIIIICPKHGVFEQTPHSHLSGHGCKKCSNENKRYNNEEFIKRAKNIHGDKYDYSNIHYKDKNDKVIIKCSKHGEFMQSYHTHIIKKSGCPKCTAYQIINKNEFLEKATKIHGYKYDYSEVEIPNVRINIICPKHGKFTQKLVNHLKGQGCPFCAGNSKKTTEQFIKKADKIHNNKYNYSNTKYNGALHKIKIICPEHGEFEQLARDHLNGSGCSKCFISSGHISIINYLKSISINNIICNDRKLIGPLELDILIPDYNIAIEYHGLHWHSFDKIETKEEKYRHYDKCNICNEKGIKLLQIFENEWIYKQDIIKSIILNKFGISTRIFARKCSIIHLNNQEYYKFIKENHLQGYVNSKIRIGLMFQDQLVCCMSFKRNKKYDWEISRFANKIGYTVVGGASKLLKEFIRNNTVEQLLTYADRRYSDGNLYRKLGFKLNGITYPNYFYIKGINTYSRQSFQKHKLKNKLKYFDPNLTESQNMFNNKYRRMWDAGHYRFLLK